MSRRSRMAPVYIGDIGIITPPTTKTGLPEGFDTSKLTFRQLCNVAVLVGIDVREIIGIKECWMHVDMVFLGDKQMPDGYNLFEHCNYCKSCWRLFRIKRLPNVD